MPSPSHALATATPAADTDRLGWLLLIPLGFLALSQFLLAWTGTIPVLQWELPDTDAYMRINRVLALHESGEWFDSRFMRVNPPDGHVQHWTRPLDALLLAGAWLLEPWLGFRTGLHVWGVLISPVLLGLTILALNWAVAPFMNRDGRFLACIALLLQIMVMAYTSVGRADHHSLLLLLCILLVGVSVRLLLTPETSWLAWGGGAVAAASVWVSPEALVFIAVSLAALGLYWLCGDDRLSSANRDYVATTAAFLALAVLIERGPAEWLTIENDRISILHVTLFLLLALFWHAVVRLAPASPLRPGLAGVARRLVLATSGVIGSALVMAGLFPQLSDGPLGPVDPIYSELRLTRIVEIQPLIRLEWVRAGQFGEIMHRFLQIFGIGLFAVPFLMAILLRRQPLHRGDMVIAFALLVFLPLGFYQQRWAIYTQLLLVVPYSAFIVWLLGWIETRLERLWLWRPIIVAVALTWPIIIPAALLPKPTLQTVGLECPVEQLAATLNTLAASESKLILAHPDYAPAVLYRTRHNVLSITNHRPQPGFAATVRILTAPPETARYELAREGVDWILLCPSIAERSVFTPNEGGEESLYRWLVDSRPPDWLHPMPLPEELRDRGPPVRSGYPDSREWPRCGRSLSVGNGD